MGRVERRERRLGSVLSFIIGSKKKDIFIAQKSSDRCGGPGMAFKHKRLLRFPWNRVSTCLDVRPTPAQARRGGGGEREGGGKKRARGNSRPLCRPSSRPIQTVVYTRVRGRSGRRNIWPTPSRAEPRRTFSPQPLIRIRGKKKEKRSNERKKERIRFGFYSKGPGFACRSVIAKLPTDSATDSTDIGRPKRTST